MPKQELDGVELFNLSLSIVGTVLRDGDGGLDSRRKVAKICVASGTFASARIELLARRRAWMVGNTVIAGG